MADADNTLQSRLIWALDLARSVIVILASCAFLFLFFVDFNELRDASKSLLKRAGTAPVEINVSGLGSVNIGQPAVTAALSPFGAEGESEEVTDAIKKLTPDEYVRLMNVYPTDNTCDFENPSASMRYFLAVDYDLKEKNLVKLEYDPDKTTKVATEISKKAKEGEPPPHGELRSCYDFLLTGKGRNVKTALVENIKTLFYPAHLEGKPAQ